MHWKQCNVIARMLILNHIEGLSLRAPCSLIDLSTFTFWEETFWWEYNIFIQGLALWIKYIVDLWPLWFYPVFSTFLPSFLPSFTHGDASIFHILSLRGFCPLQGTRASIFSPLVSLLLFEESCLSAVFPSMHREVIPTPRFHVVHTTWFTSVH